MNTYQGVFKRYEKKYLLTSGQYRELAARLHHRFTMDEYGKSTIFNIYFDTPDFRLIRSSLEKPVYKEKLRLRSYCVPYAESTVFVELKKKYNGVVYKRRVTMTLAEADSYLRLRKQPGKPSQITREIDWFLDFYHPVAPAMFISYDRTAVRALEQPDLRVTFDSNILWRTDKLRLETGAWGNQLLLPRQVLMEIKSPASLPLWLTRPLNELEIYPASFSKYGRAFEEYSSASAKKEGVFCA